jgi:hypothetical protein
VDRNARLAPASVAVRTPLRVARLREIVKGSAATKLKADTPCSNC